MTARTVVPSRGRHDPLAITQLLLLYHLLNADHRRAA
jgi:hypothetical protein